MPHWLHQEGLGISSDFRKSNTPNIQCEAVWNDSKKIFETTFDGGRRGQVTVEIDVIQFNSFRDGFEPEGFDVILYPQVAEDWQSQEAYAQLRGEPTYRYKGWCFVKSNCSYVDAYDMDGDEKMRFEMSEFGSSFGFYGHYQNEKKELFEEICRACFS